MVFSLTQLFTIGLTYLVLLFGSAYATEKGWLPARLTRHPAIRVLSLGVFAGAICFYGALGLAADYGSGYFLYFAGASSAFLIAPVLLGPLSRVALTHRLGSLADIFAFRYPAPWVGGVVSVFMLIGILPLVALQIHAISSTIHLLNQDLSEDVLAIVFCVTIIVFAILFGARHLSTRDKHQGLVVAMGFESIIKLLAFVTVAGYGVFGVFGGFHPLSLWLTQNQDWLSSLQRPLSEGSSRSLLLMFFGAAVALPHVYHILLTENDDTLLLGASRWGFPLYMLLLSACVPFILWAALKVSVHTPPEYYAIGLGIVAHNKTIAILAFVGGLAAASGVLIVSTLALASMTLNHVLLPLYRPIPGINFYSLLINTRRLLIAMIILAGYAINRMIVHGQDLMGLGIVTFVAVLQFLPGLVGAFHWRYANKSGLMAGLIAGYLVWFVTLFFPLLNDLFYANLLTASPLLYQQHLFEPGEHVWQFAAIISLAVNAVAYVIFSLLNKPTVEELHAANDCMSDSFSRPYQGELQAQSVAEIETSMSMALGPSAASREVSLALSELGLGTDERRPHTLHQIRNRIEMNLSSFMGQTIAHRIIGRFLPYKPIIDTSGSENVHTIESRLEDFHSQLTGMAGELDALRRYHRQILQELPTAVCSINKDFQVLTWNNAMERLTGIATDRIVGSPLTTLPRHWYQLLFEFATGSHLHRPKAELTNAGRRLLLSLHKASIVNMPAAQGDIVLVIEDITEEHMLEEQLMHHERLASIGQLAAGVAHEIGNPITGIACLAQNLRIETNQPELIEISDQILEQTQRISGILQSLVNFSHGGNVDVRRSSVPVDLRQCTEEAINLLSLSQRADGIVFDNRCPDGLTVLGDAQRLAQVFVNVLNNARDASENNSVVTIEGAQIGQMVEIRITDRGHGISSDHLKHVFEPFYTTKDPGKGTGLGLAIVNSIVEEHQGTISAESAGDGKGTAVILKLPIYARTDSELTSTANS